MGAPHVEAEFLNGSSDGIFNFLLRGPADLVGGQAQIAAGDKHYGFRHPPLF
jgi:hypothetical protein